MGIIVFGLGIGSGKGGGGRYLPAHICMYIPLHPYTQSSPDKPTGSRHHSKERISFPHLPRECVVRGEALLDLGDRGARVGRLEVGQARVQPREGGERGVMRGG